MRQRHSVLVALIALGLQAVLLGSARAQEPPYNRSIQGIQFAPEPAGGTRIETHYRVRLTDTSTSTIILNADVEVRVNGTLVDTHSEDGTKGDSAITCAVTCAGSCPSIFGDGVCRSCGCDYDNILTSVFGAGLSAGDEVLVSIVPARGGVNEIDTSDDSLQVSFPAIPAAGWLGMGVLTALIAASGLALGRRWRAGAVTGSNSD